nr:hypothetical protein [Tanacetum cinerariifolium]
MADMNILANNAPAEQAHAVAPPTKTDDQILPCQLDEQWFNLHKDVLRDALDITPTNDNNPYVAPPSSDTIIEYVNSLGYPSTLRNISAVSVKALYQPWKAILSMINMCLTKFVQSIQTFLTDRKNLATASRGKKKTTHLLIPNVRFTKLIIHHLKTKHNIYPRTGLPLHYSHDEKYLNTLRFYRKDGREIFGMPIPDALLTDEIKGAPYYGEYKEHWRTLILSEAFRHTESPSLDAELALNHSEMESDNVVSKIDTRDQDDGQARPNPTLEERLDKHGSRLYKLENLNIPDQESEDIHELLRKLIEDLQNISEELVKYINSPSWDRLAFYNDDNEHSIQYKEYLENSSNAIVPILPTEEPDNSLSMGDEHLNTILETKSDKVIKSSVENLVQIPSESEVTSDNECECDVSVNDESSPIFITFTNLLFDCNDNFTSSDDKSLSNEDVPMENFKIYSNPLVDDEESISPKIDP